MSDIFSDPIFLTLIITIVGGSAATIYFLAFDKPKNTFLLERLKPGYNILRNIKEERTKNPGDILLTLKDGRKYIVPAAKEGECEIVQVPKKVVIKKGWRKLWFLESDQIVKLSPKLVDASKELMDHQTTTLTTNRRSLGRLATAKGLAAGGWTLIILAVGSGLAIGYIMYPQFNHPATVVEYYKQLANGTFVPFGRP